MSDKTEQIIGLTQQYVMNTYRRFPVAFVRGEGCYLWDLEGKKYLDFLSGISVNGLGHSHPEIVRVITAQAATLVHTSNLFHIPSQAELAQSLCNQSFADKVFFCNSGAEANEAAVKLVRRWAKQNRGPECYEVITAQQSFHGRTLAMIAATGQEKIKKGFEPLPEGFQHVPFNDVPALEMAITSRTAAIMLEPVLGEGGVYFPTREYLKEVRELCDKKGILLVFDEVQSGLGRTGKFFAYENFGIRPDILTLAKSLGAGLPIGACLAKDSVAASFGPGDHASTFGGNPLVCEVAKKFLEILDSDGFLENIRKNGNLLLQGLTQMKARFPMIQDVRGLGLMLGMNLSVPGRPVVEVALKKGLVINAVQEKTLRLLPPLIVAEKEIDEGLGILEEVFSQVSKD